MWTTDQASALQRVCSITRKTRLMRSQGCQRRASTAGLTSVPTLLLEPGVPEKGERPRAEVAPQLLADHGQGEQIAELDLPHILIKEGLDAVDDALALPHFRFPGQFGEQPVLPCEAPPAGDVRKAL